MNLMSAGKQVRNKKNKIYRATMLPLLYEFETWSLNLREEHQLRILENKLLSKMFGAKKDEVTGNCTTRSCMSCTPHQILYG